MSKADVRRDYYADLGLAPNADTEDIKKQFRKLALRYHPDRNPGKEVEFNSKFQAIQAAHEILIDPTQRLKYDTDRLRAGYWKSNGASVSHNAARKSAAATRSPAASENFQQRPSSFARPNSFHGSAGAQRYASYSRAAQQQAGQKTQDHGQTRADAFRGFQGMKGNGLNASRWSQFDPKTGARSPSSGSVPRANSSQPPRPKSAYEYFKANQSTTNESPNTGRSSKKKNGFAPRTPGGDEPMAADTSAYRNASRDRLHRQDSFFQPTSSPTARKSATPQTSEVHTDSNAGFAERERSRYATSGGEKTFFSSAASGRPASMHDPRREPETNTAGLDSGNTYRPHGARPGAQSKDPETSDSSTSSSGTESGDDRPKSTPRARGKGDSYHTSGGFNPGTGYNTGSNMFFKNAQWTTAVQDGDFKFTGNLGQGTAESHGSDSASPGTSAQGSSGPGTRTAPDSTDDNPDTANLANGSRNGNFKSGSSDRVNNGWYDMLNGDFVFRANSQATPDASKRQTLKPRIPATKRGIDKKRQGETPSRGNWDSSVRQTSAAQPTSASLRNLAPREKAFNANDWTGQFADLSWFAPKGVNIQIPWTNSKRSGNLEKQRTFLNTQKPPPTSVATDAESDVGGEAMDVDDDQTADVRQEEQPQGQSDGVQQPGPKTTSVDDKIKEPQEEDGVFNMNNLGESDPFTSTNNDGINNLGDIRATLPFESQPDKTKTFADEQYFCELRCPNPPRRPRVPQLVPISAGSQQLGLPRSAWDRYVADMSIYMREWSDFNSRMLGHFNARHETVKTSLTSGWIGAVGDSTRLHVCDQERDEEVEDGTRGMAEDTLLPGRMKGGYSAYLRGLKEDVRVRKHWDVACEMHYECILQLGEMRQWIRDGGKLI